MDQKKLSPETKSRIIQELLPHSLANWREKGVKKPIRFQGKSMLPLLKEGDIIHVQFYPQVKPQPGDIVLFLHQGGFLTHRIITVVDETGSISLLEMGDNGFTPNSLDQDQVMGIVEQYRRGQKIYSLTQKSFQVYSRLVLWTQWACLLIRRKVPSFPGRDLGLNVARRVLLMLGVYLIRLAGKYSITDSADIE